MPELKREIKGSVFACLSGGPKYARALYLYLHPEDTEAAADCNLAAMFSCFYVRTAADIPLWIKFVAFCVYCPVVAKLYILVVFVKAKHFAITENANNFMRHSSSPKPNLIENFRAWRNRYLRVSLSSPLLMLLECVNYTSFYETGAPRKSILCFPQKPRLLFVQNAKIAPFSPDGAISGLTALSEFGNL